MLLLSPLDRLGVLAGARAVPTADVVFAADQLHFDLAGHLQAEHGWDGESRIDVTVVIPAGRRAYATDPGTPAFLVSGSFAATGSEVRIVVESGGAIDGAGGWAGGANGGHGGQGGPALVTQSPTTVDNAGALRGGGGGGGGGAQRSGGSSDPKSGCMSFSTANGGAGGRGQGGQGGAQSGAAGQTIGCATGGTGGTGGGFGTSGGGGAFGFGCDCNLGNGGTGAGGAAGLWADGTDLIVWEATGTRLGGSAP